MNKMISSAIFIAAAMTLMPSCSKDEPVLTVRDWEGTTKYFSSSDEKGFGTYYSPYVGYVGDPMPFYDPVAKDFKIMYLQDFTVNQTGTYHPIWAVKTSDAASYESMGELVPCGAIHDQDAAIGTGSTVYDGDTGLYYTFYTGNKYQPTASESGQVVMLATSSDFKTWTKDRTLYIKGVDYGYSRNDFRDPFVYEGEDGKWHMLVSTIRTSDNKGVIAEFVSEDLLSWEHAGVFMTMMWDRFYECPDLFRMGDWWYLVYSEKHAAIRKVQYFKGRTLDDLKACTANDAGLWPDGHEGFLDSRGFYAGKTASDGQDRYIWGWCPNRPGNDNTDVGASPAEPSWGGNMVAHRIIQHEDGTLTLGPVSAIEAKYSSEQDVRVMALPAAEEGASVSGTVATDDGTAVAVGDGVSGKTFILSGDSYMLMSRLNVHNRLEFTVTTGSASDKFGFSFARGTDSGKYYSLILNPESDETRKLNFEEEGSAGKGYIDGIDSYMFSTPSDNVYHVTVCTDNSVCTVYVNDVLAYTNRIYGTQKNCWSINCYGGDITVDGIGVRYY